MSIFDLFKDKGVVEMAKERIQGGTVVGGQKLVPGVKSLNVIVKRGNGEVNGIVEVEFDADQVGGAQMAEGTDSFIVLDFSGSMRGLYYKKRVHELATHLLNFLSQYDDDGVEVLLHSIQHNPGQDSFVNLGVIATEEDLYNAIEEWVASGKFGGGTWGAPAIRHIVDVRKKEQSEYRGENRKVFIEMVTDGEFHDEREIMETVKYITRKFDFKSSPNEVKIHFTGIGSDTSFAFLKELDDWGAKAGIPDIVDFDEAKDIAEAPAKILKEMRSGLIVVGRNATISAISDSGSVLALGDAKTNRYEQDNTFYGYEELPEIAHIGFRISGDASTLTLPISFDTDSGKKEIELTVKLR
jgi:hypothetical protein